MAFSQVEARTMDAFRVLMWSGMLDVSSLLALSSTTSGGRGRGKLSTLSLRNTALSVAPSLVLYPCDFCEDGSLPLIACNRIRYAGKMGKLVINGRDRGGFLAIKLSPAMVEKALVPHLVERGSTLGHLPALHFVNWGGIMGVSNDVAHPYREGEPLLSSQ
jgi:hypothetical protein